MNAIIQNFYNYMIFNRKLFLPFLLTFFSLIFSQGCQKDNPINIENSSNPSSETNLVIVNSDSNLVEYSEIYSNQKYNFKSEKINDEFHSSFTITDLNTTNEIFSTDYIFDNSINNFKVYQSENVEEIASSLNFGITVDEYVTLKNQYFDFFKNILNNSYNESTKSLLEQLFFHKSIINVKLRSLSANSPCECSVYAGYLVNKMNFTCQEDLFVPVSVINELVRNEEQQFANSRQAQLFDRHIQSQLEPNQTEISFDKIYSFYGSKQQYIESLNNLKNGNQNRGCIFGQGSSHGCCGNYAGCCYFWHVGCWIHDKQCGTCSPEWYCLPGCVED